MAVNVGVKAAYLMHTGASAEVASSCRRLKLPPNGLELSRLASPGLV